MTAALRQTLPDVGVAPRDIAPRQTGRPLGSFEPHTLWLRGVIVEMRRSGHGCTDTFRRLCLDEDPGPVAQSFSVSAETADDVWQEIGGDIRGHEVFFEGFKKLWKRT